MYYNPHTELALARARHEDMLRQAEHDRLVRSLEGDRPGALARLRAHLSRQPQAARRPVTA